jgi:hypothetical protein
MQVAAASAVSITLVDDAIASRLALTTHPIERSHFGIALLPGTKPMLPCARDDAMIGVGFF